MSPPGLDLFSKTTRHDPIRVGERTLTPVSRTIGLRAPWFGWAWHFPVAVEVEEAGSQTRLPIVDRTRRALIAIALLVVILLAIPRKG